MIYLNKNRTDYKKFPGGTSGKEPAKQEAQETWAQFLDWENPLEKRNGNPLQYSFQEISMDRGACQATVHGVAKSQTLLK